MTFNSDSNMRPTGSKISPSTEKKLEDKIDAIAADVSVTDGKVEALKTVVNSDTGNITTVNATTVNLTNETVTGTATVNKIEANTVDTSYSSVELEEVVEANINSATIGTLNATTAEVNSINAQSYSGNKVEVTEVAANIVTGLTVDTESLTTDTLVADGEAEFKNDVIMRADQYFPGNDSKVYGEYLEVEAVKIETTTAKVKSLIEETPQASSNIVGFNSDGKLISVDMSLDPTNLWQNKDSATIEPKSDKGIYAGSIEATSVTANSVISESAEIQSLTADSIDTSSVTTTSLNAETVDTTKVTSSEAEITDLTSDKATVKDFELETTYNIRGRPGTATIKVDKGAIITEGEWDDYQGQKNNFYLESGRMNDRRITIKKGDLTEVGDFSYEDYANFQNGLGIHAQLKKTEKKEDGIYKYFNGVIIYPDSLKYEQSITGLSSKSNIVTINESGIGIITPKLSITGDIYQNGSAYETHAEKLYTKKDEIITRDGATTGLATGEYTGIRATKYDGTNDGQLVFDKDGIARVGDVGDTQPLLTRSEAANLTDGQLFKWDATNKKAIGVTIADVVASGNTAPVSSNAVNDALTDLTQIKNITVNNDTEFWNALSNSSQCTRVININYESSLLNGYGTLICAFGSDTNVVNGIFTKLYNSISYQVCIIISTKVIEIKELATTSEVRIYAVNGGFSGLVGNEECYRITAQRVSVSNSIELIVNRYGTTVSVKEVFKDSGWTYVTNEQGTVQLYWSGSTDGILGSATKIG